LVPESQLGDALRTGELVRLGPGHEDVVLHWEYWRLESTRLTRLTDTIRSVAQCALRPVR
jgi:LysR family transcriptional regulator (chromosome initiation inhibitor)